jgi:hypothetical protein
MSTTGEVKYQTLAQEPPNHIQAFISCKKQEIPHKIIQEAITDIKNNHLSVETKQAVLGRIRTVEKYRENHPILHLINSVFQHIMGQKTSEYLLSTLKAELGDFSDEDVQEALIFYRKEIATSAQASLGFLNENSGIENYTDQEITTLKNSEKTPKGLREELEAIETAHKITSVTQTALKKRERPRSPQPQSKTEGFFQKIVSMIPKSSDLSKYISSLFTAVSSPSKQDAAKPMPTTEKSETPEAVIEKYKEALTLLADNKPIEDTKITTELKNCVESFLKLPKLTKAILRENSFTLIGRRDKTVRDLLKICQVNKKHLNKINLYGGLYYDPKRIDIVMRTLLHEGHYDVFEGMAIFRYEPSSSFGSTYAIPAGTQNHDLNTIKMAIENLKAFKKNPIADTLKVVISIPEGTGVAPLFELIKKEALRFVSENQDAKKAAEELITTKDKDILLILAPPKKNESPEEFLSDPKKNESPEEYESMETREIKRLKSAIQSNPSENRGALIGLAQMLERALDEKKRVFESLEMTYIVSDSAKEFSKSYKEQFITSTDSLINTIINRKDGKDQTQAISKLQRALNDKKEFFRLIDEPYTPSASDKQAEELIKAYNDRQSRPQDFDEV